MFTHIKAYAFTDVTINTRYGTWDPKQATVLPPVDPAATTTTSTTTTAVEKGSGPGTTAAGS